MIPDCRKPAVTILVKPPVLVIDKVSGDLTAHRSLEDVEGYIETYDVIRNEHVVYDGEGRLLRVTVLGGKVTDPVKIVCAESEPVRSSELREALIWFLLQMKVQKEWLTEASLEDLVAKASEYAML